MTAFLPVRKENVYVNSDHVHVIVHLSGFFFFENSLMSAHIIYENNCLSVYRLQRAGGTHNLMLGPDKDIFLSFAGIARSLDCKVTTWLSWDEWAHSDTHSRCGRSEWHKHVRQCLSWCKSLQCQFMCSDKHRLNIWFCETCATTSSVNLITRQTSNWSSDLPNFNVWVKWNM